MAEIERIVAQPVLEQLGLLVLEELVDRVGVLLGHAVEPLLAYQLGDLYESRGFKQYERAAAYFDRCYEWNPKTQHDARLRAARLYERQLNNRGKAATIYKLIINHETDERRMEEAKRRLQELSNRP